MQGKVAQSLHCFFGLPVQYRYPHGHQRQTDVYKRQDLANCGDGTMTDDVIRLREEIARQISALKGMKKMAEAYGYDLSLIHI